MYNIAKGVPLLGCLVSSQGVNFGIFSDRAERMLLEIYEDATCQLLVIRLILDREHFVVENIFHVLIEDIKPQMAYIWKVLDSKGMSSPPLIDPYAYCIRRGEGSYCSVVAQTSAYKGTRPYIPWDATIIYEVHVGHFTKDSSSDVPEEERGTFAGLIRKLPYLKSLGVTTLELLPIFTWNPYTTMAINPLTGERIQDIWGYNTIGFFSVDERYTKEGYKAIDEFKALVEVAHENGLEIILDVVYNHTGEGDQKGPAFHFKYLSNNTYYKRDEQGEYRNCSGTGNTLNTNHKVIKKLILDSLRYWTVDMGVDGFRFDLASILGQDEEGKWMNSSLLNEIAEDPILSQLKLITESWDAKGSYNVGHMPYPFREWSDYFRDTIRKFIKGDEGIIRSVADCILGKEIHFTQKHKEDTHAVHFITAHDGFTLWDLVAYNQKHNTQNGENNRDGNNVNHSHNWGVEGETDNIEIINIRNRCMKNAMCFLLLSRGIPMLLMGDEIGRTQQGNNNAFCQDYEGVWMKWHPREEFKKLLYFTKELIHLRKSLKYFKTEERERSKVTWHGVHYNEPDWSYCSRSIAWHIEDEDEEENLYIIANSYHEPLLFELPPTQTRWLRIVDTHLTWLEDISATGTPVAGNSYQVADFSFCIFRQQRSMTI